MFSDLVWVVSSDGKVIGRVTYLGHRKSSLLLSYDKLLAWICFNGIFGGINGVPIGYLVGKPLIPADIRLIPIYPGGHSIGKPFIPADIWLKHICQR